MTREEAKELLPIMQAFADGKTIQGRTKNRPWFDLLDNKLEMCGLFEYRIKPEQKYRPFKSKEECWNEMLKHQPFGWVKDTSNRAFYSILEVINEGCVFAYGPVMPFDDIYKYHTFADGKPFGIKEF